MAIALNLSIWWNYFAVGQSAISVGDLQLAEKMFREALEFASASGIKLVHQADSAYGLALALLPGGANERAEGQQLLRKAVRLYSTHNQKQNQDLNQTNAAKLNTVVFVGAVTALADSYCQERFPERALPLLKEAVKIVAARDGLSAPQLVPLFKRMALIYSEKKYFAKAEKFYRRSCQSY